MITNFKHSAEYIVLHFMFKETLISFILIRVKVHNLGGGGGQHGGKQQHYKYTSSVDMNQHKLSLLAPSN
jgi:hypothetical protein